MPPSILDLPQGARGPNLLCSNATLTQVTVPHPQPLTPSHCATHSLGSISSSLTTKYAAPTATAKPARMATE